MKYYKVLFTVNVQEEDCLEDVYDVLAALAGQAGFETFEEAESGLVGYVQLSAFDRDQLDAMLQELPFSHTTVSYQVEEAQDQDWNETWEQEGFEPIAIGNHLIVHDGRHLPAEASAEDTLITIDARMAFGTGNHATTRLMGTALLNNSPQGAKVLDCGTGTGILAIIALKCGAIRAIGYDIDQWSVDNALHNAALNGVGDHFTALLGDATVIGTLNDTFDMVLANINRNILLADMPSMCQALNPGGKLIISGFYTSDVDMLTARAEQLGLTLLTNYHDGEWACIVFMLPTKQ